MELVLKYESVLTKLYIITSTTGAPYKDGHHCDTRQFLNPHNPLNIEIEMYLDKYENAVISG